MIDKNSILNNIFITRKHHQKDENDILIKTEDNIEIAIRLFLQDKNYPTIIFFHGNGEISQDYDEISKIYNSFNLNLIVSDYRGYGLSEGVPNKENLHNDSLTVIDYVEKYLNDNEYNNKFIVMGRSLGSASAAHIIENRPNVISGCIIESGFATEYPLLDLMNIEPDSINFTLSDGFDNLRKFKSYIKPLLIIHSDLDDIIPFSQADIIFIETPSKNKDILKVSGANHNNIIMVARDHYFQRIKKFIDSIST